jgi:hypothetical protein
MTKTRNITRLRALLHQRFSEGPHNVLNEMRRPHTRPPRVAQKESPSDLLQGLLQRGLQSTFQDLGKGMSPFAGGGAGGSGGGGGFDIDQLVAGSLMEGPRTTSVLRSLFNLVPSLIGR